MTVLGLILILSLTGVAILAYADLPDNLTPSEKFDNYFPIALIALVNGLIMWMMFDTNYILDDGYLNTVAVLYTEK